jgi:hypothetical protein
LDLSKTNENEIMQTTCQHVSKNTFGKDEILSTLTNSIFVSLKKEIVDQVIS